MKYSFNPPGIIKACFSKFYWNTTNGKVLLTFDDGPLEKNTQLILDELKKINAKALFFCVGENI
ncbi:MAG: polysaccharide deacetylase family protein, partial [Ignavibacteriales bacterium]